jgi:hypothetical protein
MIWSDIGTMALILTAVLSIAFCYFVVSFIRYEKRNIKQAEAKAKARDAAEVARSFEIESLKKRVRELEDLWLDMNRREEIVFPYAEPVNVLPALVVSNEIAEEKSNGHLSEGIAIQAVAPPDDSKVIHRRKKKSRRNHQPARTVKPDGHDTNPDGG